MVPKPARVLAARAEADGIVTLTLDAGGGESFQLSDEITAPACEGPAELPEVTFTFVKTPSVSYAIL